MTDQPPDGAQPAGPGPDAGLLDALVPTNPLAAVACWAGIFSCLLCVAGPVLGPLAVATGVISLKKGALIQQSRYGKATSTARSWIGIVTGGLGTIAGTIMILWLALGKR